VVVCWLPCMDPNRSGGQARHDHEFAIRRLPPVLTRFPPPLTGSATPANRTRQRDSTVQAEMPGAP